ncbi:hypothetical protein HMPREF3190_00557 [Umbribacter vaginalis]|nr:hypothetical protein HMPREF3190_00557 [Coriobacteriales bacterium DNF00809]
MWYSCCSACRNAVALRITIRQVLDRLWIYAVLYLTSIRA